MPTDTYILDAVRTPFGRYSGALAGVRPDDLAAGALKALLDRTPDLDPAEIDDVILGNANGAGEDNRDVALGASGARIVGRLAHELHNRGGGYGLAAICIGAGQGLAVVLEG